MKEIISLFNFSGWRLSLGQRLLTHWRHSLVDCPADLKDELLFVVDFNHKFIVFLDELVERVLVVEAEVGDWELLAAANHAIGTNGHRALEKSVRAKLRNIGPGRDCNWRRSLATTLTEVPLRYWKRDVESEIELIFCQERRNVAHNCLEKTSFWHVGRQFAVQFGLHISMR